MVSDLWADKQTIIMQFALPIMPAHQLLHLCSRSEALFYFSLLIFTIIWHKIDNIVNEFPGRHLVAKHLQANRIVMKIWVVSLHCVLERPLTESLGKREGGDTGSSTALCNYCRSCCIVTISDRLWHRWIWPQSQGPCRVKGQGCSKLTRKPGAFVRQRNTRQFRRDDTQLERAFYWI